MTPTRSSTTQMDQSKSTHLRPMSPAANQEERQLLKRVMDQDTQAFETLYDQYAPLVRRALYRRLSDHDLVEEALNDVMLVLWQRADRVPDHVPLGAWLQGIARITALNSQTRATRHTHCPLSPTDVDAAPAPETALLQNEHERLFARAIASFPDPERQALEMSLFGGLSNHEIAVQTQSNVNTVKTRIKRARHRLMAGETALRQTLLSLCDRRDAA